MAYWVDEMTFGVGPGLGKIVYQHIHDDDTFHPCQITPLPHLERGEVWLASTIPM